MLLQRRIERMVPKGYEVAVGFDIISDDMFVRILSPGRRHWTSAKISGGNVRCLR